MRSFPWSIGRQITWSIVNSEECCPFKLLQEVSTCIAFGDYTPEMEMKLGSTLARQRIAEPTHDKR